MHRRALLAAALGVLLAGAVLVDGWVPPAWSAHAEGEGTQARGADPELAGPRAPGLRSFVEGATPSRPDLNVVGEPAAVVPPTADEPGDAPALPKPVDPSGWLGRRHHRSPA